MESLERALRTLLTPLTHNLPAPIQQTATSLLGASCYRTLVHDLTISDTVCLKLAISKGLGIGIIGASSVVKIPQLLKILNSQSGEGISMLSYVLETLAYVIGLAYNVRNGFAFSTYGEMVLIAVQNVAISVLVLQFGGRGAWAAVWVAGLAAAGYGLLNAGIVDMAMLQYLQAGAGLLGVASKLPQIITIAREGGTGQLSAFAVFNYLAGSLSRIFTTLQEVPDPLILYGFIAGFALNAILALQMVYYWNAPASKATESKKLNEKGKQAIKMGGAINGATTGADVRAKGKNSPSTRRRG